MVVTGCEMVMEPSPPVLMLSLFHLASTVRGGCVKPAACAQVPDGRPEAAGPGPPVRFAIKPAPPLEEC